MRVCKKWILGLIVINLIGVTASIVSSADEKVFLGEIADTPCAMQVHSLDKTHTEMLKVKGVGTTSTDCTLYCIRNRGGRFVLQNKHSVYLLDKQELAEPYAGRNVRVTGTLDPKTETIQVRSIDPVTER